MVEVSEEDLFHQQVKLCLCHLDVFIWKSVKCGLVCPKEITMVTHGASCMSSWQHKASWLPLVDSRIICYDSCYLYCLATTIGQYSICSVSKQYLNIKFDIFKHEFLIFFSREIQGHPTEAVQLCEHQLYFLYCFLFVFLFKLPTSDLPQK